MDILIRPERDGELTEIMSLVESAFADVEESDHREQELVERLHRSDAFVPALSLVAEDDRGKIVGYILLSEASIVGYAEEGGQPEWLTLAVAPLAVRPDFWGRGIGGTLLRRAHSDAAALGYGTAVLLGHAGYYPRFGYERAGDHGIVFPLDAPPECCMVRELRPDVLDGVRGTVRYPAAFGI